MLSADHYNNIPGAQVSYPYKDLQSANQIAILDPLSDIIIYTATILYPRASYEVSREKLCTVI